MKRPERNARSYQQAIVWTAIMLGVSGCVKEGTAIQPPDTDPLELTMSQELIPPGVNSRFIVRPSADIDLSSAIASFPTGSFSDTVMFNPATRVQAGEWQPLNNYPVVRGQPWTFTLKGVIVDGGIGFTRTVQYTVQ